MRLHRLLASCALAGAYLLAATGFAAASPITSIVISAEHGQEIVFEPGGTFHFGTTPSDPAFNVSGATGGSGALIGLTGRIDGAFSFDDPAGASIVPLVSASGMFILDDGAGNIFSAPLRFDTIAAYTGPFGGFSGTVDFAAATYGGANGDLVALAGMAESALSILFHITPSPLTLDTLYQAPARLRERGMSTFSGMMLVSQVEATVTVPEPAMAALLGAGLLTVGAVRRRTVSRSVPGRTSAR